MKTQLLVTVLAINGVLAIASSVFAAPIEGTATDSDVDTAALSRAIASSLNFEDDALSLVHVAIDRALLAKQIAENKMVRTLGNVKSDSSPIAPKIPVVVTAGLPRLP